MRQRWERLTFLHWAFDPAEVAKLLPDGLTPDLHDGKAWVGLVPFSMVVATSGGRTAPWVSRFPETNVRTYVRDSDGHVGIWFFSLDAARFGAVAVARTTYRLPYYWSAMDVAGDDASIAYRCYRRWPGPGTASSRVRVDIGDPYQPDELTEFDHFLTARWILFSAAGLAVPAGPGLPRPLAPAPSRGHRRQRHAGQGRRPPGPARRPAGPLLPGRRRHHRPPGTLRRPAVAGAGGQPAAPAGQRCCRSPGSNNSVGPTTLSLQRLRVKLS